MHKKILPPLSILILILFISCKKNVCPPDKKLGDLDLRSATLEFNPYSGNEKLVFKNTVGDSLILLAPDGKKVTRDQLCIKTICTEPKIKGNSTCEYFGSETHRFIFRDDAQTTLMDLLFFSEVYEENTQKFYSMMRVGFSTGNYISQASTVTDIQFSENFLESKTGVNQFLMEKNSIILNGKEFTNILAAEEDAVKYYYSKTQGLIGFKTPDATWNLDRVE
ncbi:MAG: hypothetical protein AB8H03_07880 [Saprospiraceae bacterium]